MRDGHRVVDTDSHVFPAVELLYEQGAPEFRGRWEQLKLHLRLRDDVRPEAGDWERAWLELAPGSSSSGASATWPSSGAEPGVLHDNPEGRLRWMDGAGIDVQLILPAGVTAASTALDLGTSVGLLQSFNRYLTGYCDADPERMKATLQLHGAAPIWSVEEIGRYADERSVAAFSICLPEQMGIDDPALEPIWQASGELGLPLVHHAFPLGSSLVPSYLRTAAHQWSAQRLLGALVQAGLFERHPALRVILAASGAGWIPAWLQRVGGLEHAREGRIAAALDLEEDEPVAESVMSWLGEDALVWQSRFPSRASAADPLGWERVDDRIKAKVLAGNAERCLRLL